MNKWIVAGVVVVIAGAAAPWGTGVLTEKQWAEGQKRLNGQQLVVGVETERYDRGYLGASVAGTVQFEDPDSGEQLEIPWQGQVSHGFVSSQVDIEFGSSDSELMQQLFPAEKPSLSISLNAWGTAGLVVAVPAIDARDEATGESLKMAEAVVRIGVHDAGDSFDLVLEWPGLVARGPDVELTLGDVTVNQTMSRLRGDVWTGEGSLALENATLDPSGQPGLSLQGMSLQSTTSADNSDSFSVDSTFGIEQVVSDGIPSGPHRARFVMQDFAVDPWNRLLGAFGDMQMLSTTAEVSSLSRQALLEQQMQAMDAVSSALRDLAAAGLSFGFPEVNLEFPEGQISGEVMLYHPQLTTEEGEALTLVMQRLTGSMDVRLPVDLVESRPALMEELAPLVQQGILVRDGGDFVLKARLEDLEVDVNGNRFPLPPMI
ncbi:DUF945 family protein [Marinobacter sp.]|uniref:DUF945 family protein n=1 Tax=Marinobacter sp. TaxID=50741 RepID=UPI00384D4703